MDLDHFVESCRAAALKPGAARAVRDLLEPLLQSPAAIIDRLGEPGRVRTTLIYRDETITIANMVWQPNQVFRPHEHRLWAVVGIYAGREDNILWRRPRRDSGRRIEPIGAKSIAAGESLILGKGAIHSVINPTARFTGAIHIYGGDLVAIERSEWDPETLLEAPYDLERARSETDGAGR